MAQIARIASTISRIRAAGRDHGIENRFSMCGLICEPSPRIARPSENVWRSQPMWARFIGLRANADRDRGREVEPLGVLGREREREERVVRALERVDAVVAHRLDLARDPGHLGQRGGDERRVDLHGVRHQVGSGSAGPSSVNSATYGSGSPSQR